MPSTRVNAQSTSVAGVNPTYTAVDLVNGSNFLPASGRLLIFQNVGGGSVTVTFTTPAQVEGLTVQDPTVVVPAASSRAVSLGEAVSYRNGNGEAEFTATGAINVAVLQA